MLPFQFIRWYRSGACVSIPRSSVCSFFRVSNEYRLAFCIFCKFYSSFHLCPCFIVHSIGICLHVQEKFVPPIFFEFEFYDHTTATLGSIVIWAGGSVN